MPVFGGLSFIDAPGAEARATTNPNQATLLTAKIAVDHRRIRLVPGRRSLMAVPPSYVGLDQALGTRHWALVSGASHARQTTVTGGDVRSRSAPAGIRQGFGRRAFGGRDRRLAQLESTPMARWTFGEFVLDLTPASSSARARRSRCRRKPFTCSSIPRPSTRPGRSPRPSCRSTSGPARSWWEKNLTNLVSEYSARRFGEDPAHPQFIRTVPVMATPSAARRLRRPHERPAHNLPAPLTNFIGREREMVEIQSLMAAARLVTLTGAGGCGKTRLALEAAATVLDRFADGVWFVDLAALSDAGLLTQTVASALGLREGPGRSIGGALEDFVRTRRMLLVLDNCEHFDCRVRAARGGAASCGSGAAHPRDEPRGIGPGWGNGVARAVVVAPGIGRGAARRGPARQSDAVRLFVARATAVDSTFAFTHDNASVVTEVCRRLDGIPLALELAAARLKVLSIDQIHARLHDRFALLTGGSRTAVARQRTLEATVQWSYDLLSDAERRLLHWLSVFAGGWTIEAAEDVTTGDGIERQELLDSAVPARGQVARARRARRRRRPAVSLSRDRPAVRAERLLQSGEAGRLRDRHLSFFYDLARRAEPELLSHDQLAWLNRLDRDR